MNILSMRTKVRLVLLTSLISISVFSAQALCDNQQTRPSFRSYEAAVTYYLESGKLEWMHPQSSAIHKAAYHKDDQVMIIYFTSNIYKGYIFDEVPKDLWEEFKNAPSKGRFYNTRIKGKFGYDLE